MAHSRSFLANQKARNAIVGAENLLIRVSLLPAIIVASHYCYLSTYIDLISLL